MVPKYDRIAKHLKIIEPENITSARESNDLGKLNGCFTRGVRDFLTWKVTDDEQVWKAVEWQFF